MKNVKGIYLAKQFVLGKIDGQNLLLNKYGLRSDFSDRQKVIDTEEADLKTLGKRLIGLESKRVNYTLDKSLARFQEQSKTQQTGRFQGLRRDMSLSHIP